MEAKVGLEFIANMDYEAITITSLKEIAQHRPNDTKAFHLPTDDVICIKCPRSLWRTEKDNWMVSNRPQPSAIAASCTLPLGQPTTYCHR